MSRAAAAERRTGNGFATLEAILPEIRPKRLILTHMSDDMLRRLDSLPHETAADGMVVEV